MMLSQDSLILEILRDPRTMYHHGHHFRNGVQYDFTAAEIQSAHKCFVDGLLKDPIWMTRFDLYAQ